MKGIINKLIIISFTVIMTVAWTGCKDWLDIRPEGQTVLEDFWQSESDAEEVLISCYRRLGQYDAVSRMMLWGELRSDNVVANLVTEYNAFKILNLDIDPTNSICSWGGMYSVINLCNTFLYYAPGVVKVDNKFTELELNVMRSEALTLRALSYFYLVRTFGRVPYITDASIDDTQDYFYKQADEDSILQNLVVDLREALRYAPDSYAEDLQAKGRITKNAVRALLADVYLWQEDYNGCIDMCTQVMADPNLKLETADKFLTNVFANGNSDESIFELQFDEDEYWNGTVYNYYGNSSDENGWLLYPDYLLASTDKEERLTSPFAYKVSSDNIESEEDYRLKLFVLEDESAGKNYIFKYAGQSVDMSSDELRNSDYTYQSSTPNWIVYRLADVILMKAEALVQRGSDQDLSDALDLVNMTYLRSNPDLGNDSLSIDDYAISASDMEKLVLRERQRELLFEGKRWFDLMRLARRANSTKPILSYVTIKYSATEGMQDNKLAVMDALYLPIAQSEMDANPELEQNDFYKLTSGNSSSSN